MNDVVKVPTVLMRGGTSKGLVINKKDLPSEESIRDEIILRIYGSPDARQIDGVGGGTPLTSKLALIEKSEDEDIDIIYTFGQVSLTEKSIDYKPTCGNISAAVGLYAVEEDFVSLEDEVTTVRIYNTNTKKIIEVEVPTNVSGPLYTGDYSIAGVPGTGPKVNVNFLDSGGAMTGEILPTGNALDKIELSDGQSYEVTVVDSANTLIFVSASQLGISGDEIGEDFNTPSLLDKLETIRVSVGKEIGLIGKDEIVSPTSHALPKIAVFAPPMSYKTSNGKTIEKSEIDVTGRYIAMGSLHQAFAVSGAIAMATAAQIEGTNINRSLSNQEGPIKIGHPSGVIEADAKVVYEDEQYTVERAAIGRTARRIMEGNVIVENYLYSNTK